MIVLLARIHLVKEVHKHACENQALPAGLTTKEKSNIAPGSNTASFTCQDEAPGRKDTEQNNRRKEGSPRLRCQELSSQTEPHSFHGAA